MDLQNEAVVVVGASGAAGQAIALQFWRRGAKVALLARRADALTATQQACLQSRDGPGLITILLADAADKTSLSRSIEEAVTALGDVSLVVNMIGPQPARNEQRVSHPSATESWARVFQLNLEVASHIALVACPLLAAHHRFPRNSSLILFGSALIRYISTPNQTPWHAAKIGVNSLARGLFLQYRPQHVKVTCINPSPLSGLAPSALFSAIVHAHLVPSKCAVTSIDLNAISAPKNIKKATVETVPHVVLVAGGSRGIGRGIALEFAANGMHVAVLGTNKNAVDETVVLCCAAKKGEAIGIVADVNDLAAVENAVQQVIKKWGRLSVVVYSAGVNRRRPALVLDSKTQEYKSADAKVWNQLLDVNVRGAMNVTAQAVPHLAHHAVNYPSAGAPTIVYISSSWVRQKGQVGQSTYVASKKFINGFADGMSLDLRPFGIKITALNAGLVNTDLGVRGRSDGVKVIPAEEQIQPSELARTALYVVQSQTAISEIDVETMRSEIPDLDRAGKDTSKTLTAKQEPRSNL